MISFIHHFSLVGMMDVDADMDTIEAVETAPVANAHHQQSKVALVDKEFFDDFEDDFDESDMHP